jgi:hypothetical protein
MDIQQSRVNRIHTAVCECNRDWDHQDVINCIDSICTEFKDSRKLQQQNWSHVQQLKSHQNFRTRLRIQFNEVYGKGDETLVEF